LAFARLTWRVSLHDIETRRLANANESRTWLIWSDLAAVESISPDCVRRSRLAPSFPTRAKSPMNTRRQCSTLTDRSSGVISDQQVMFNG